MDDRDIERWDAVWADVETYDASTTLTKLTDALDGLTAQQGPLVVPAPRSKDTSASFPKQWTWEGKHQGKQQVVSAVVSDVLCSALPHVYGRRQWRVGNETFGGCFCHAFPEALSRGSAAGAQWVAGELELMLSALRAWGPIIEQVDGATDKARAAREGATAIVDVMIDHGWISESWYGLASDGVRWMVQACTGLALDAPPLRDLHAGHFKFSSWTAPTPPQKRAYSDAVAAIFAAR